MGLSNENVTGLILALASSLFIGSSFIIKKQGLRRAASTYGVRAGHNFLFLLLNSERKKKKNLFLLIIIMHGFEFLFIIL